MAIINIDQKKLIYKDKFKSSEKDFFFRKREIKLWLEDIINTFLPAECIIEDAFINPKTIKSNITLLRLHGAIGSYIKSRGVNVRMIAISSSRAFLNIKPNKKEVAFEWVKQNFQEAQFDKFKDDNDMADAIIVALNVYNKEKLKEF